MAKSRANLRPMVGPSTTTTRPRRQQQSPSAWRAVRFLLRPETIGATLVVLAAAALSWILPFAWTVHEVRDDIVRFLGLHVFTAIGLIMTLGALLIRRRLDTVLHAWRLWLGWFIVALVLSGVLTLWRPEWRLGGVSLEEVTAGGELGRSFVGSTGGIFLLLLLSIVAGFLLTPQAMLDVLRYTPVAMRTVWNWHIPGRVYRLVRTIILNFFPNEPPDSRTIPLESAMWARSSVAVAEPDADIAPPPIVRAPRRAAEAPVVEPPVSEPVAVITAAHWQMPPLDILKAAQGQEDEKPDNGLRARLIEQTLASFGVDAKVVQIAEGPTVTQFGIEPGWEVKTRTITERDKDGKVIFEKDGAPKTHVEEVSRTRVRVNQVTNLANDLALALAAPSIRIEAPVPGKSVIGIEVPNHVASVVTLRSVIESMAFQRLEAKSRLAVALGQGVSGEAIVADLTKAPHLLIAGATGSGKSVCINSIIACILMHASPEEVRFIMIDPKRVELTPFQTIPHLVFSDIVVDVEKVVGTLQAVIHEMDSRYKQFAAMAVRNIEAYNRSPKVEKKLPYWVVIIDELADLMMAAPVEVEKQLCRLAQLARATGIHLVVATQRPSVDVVTGLIKANFPTRIAFAVTSQVDSRTILDSVGAEKLLGRGDMLFMPTDAAKPRRIQGVYVSDQEIEELVEYWSSESFLGLPIERYDHLLEEIEEAASGGDSDEDPIMERARELALEHSRISTSLIQRRLRIGYNRAARIMEELEHEGIVGPPEGSGSREVLVMTAADLGPDE